MATLKVRHVEAAAEAAGRKDKSRLNTGSSGPKVDVGVKIGGAFAVTKNPAFLGERLAIFDTIKARRAAEFAGAKEEPITITLPDGKSFDGVAWKTTPMDIASAIAKGLAQNALAAKVNAHRFLALSCEAPERTLEKHFLHPTKLKHL